MVGEASAADMATMWTILCGALVFFMQGGFSMLEQGAVHESVGRNVMFKNLIDTCISTIMFMLIGYGLAFGEGGSFAGGKGDAFDFWDYDANLKADHFFFQASFAGACSTIVSGAIAGRVTMRSYILYSVIVSGFIYPIIVHWVWGGGFMTYGGSDSSFHFFDFAGSGVVHLTGGTLALVACAIIGPRQTENTNPRAIDFVVLGTFILWLGWYGFNCGSTTDMKIAALVAANTTIAASSGLLSSIFMVSVIENWYSVFDACGGLLGGLVAITAGAPVMSPPIACLIGAIAGPVYYVADRGIKKLGIDDAVGAFPVHGACGMWGLIATGLFYTESLMHAFGANYSRGTQLGYQLLGMLIIFVWTAFTGMVAFGALHHVIGLRIDKQTEEEGLDLKYHVEMGLIKVDENEVQADPENLIEGY